jgi:hypothetical protein
MRVSTKAMSLSMREIAAQIQATGDWLPSLAVLEAAQRLDDLAALASEMAGMLAHDMVRPDGCKACAMQKRLADLGVVV